MYIAMAGFGNDMYLISFNAVNLVSLIINYYIIIIIQRI